MSRAEWWRDAVIYQVYIRSFADGDGDGIGDIAGSRERARYVFRDGRGRDGAEPPTNWRSHFGGPAWTRVADGPGEPGQWYLHLFDPGQPDLDWSHPDVAAEFEAVLRFWFDRGVD